MKNLLFCFIILSVLIVACNNKDPYIPGTATSLSPTELQLSGTWAVQQETDSQLTTINNVVSVDTVQTYTGYDSVYVMFTDTLFNSYNLPNDLLCYDASGLGGGVVISPGNVQAPGTTYWYYNTTANKLVVSTFQYDISSITDSSLVLDRSTSDGNVTNTSYYYFKKK